MKIIILMYRSYKLVTILKIIKMDTTKKLTCEEAFIQACKELNLDPVNLPIVDLLPKKDQRSIIAYYKLTIIIRALNGDWEADFFNSNQNKYWNYLWVDHAGFACASANHAATATSATFGSRLCFKEYKTAQFAIENFKSLYEEYLLIK